MPETRIKKALVIVDHGSPVPEANDILALVARKVGERRADFETVEHCHMELAHPTMEEAFEKCVKRGATEVIVHPYFLVPGRHSGSDIPAMAKRAAKKFPGLRHKVTEPLGLHEKIVEVVLERVSSADVDKG